MNKKELKRLEKAPPNMRGTHADDFIKTFGNTNKVNAFLTTITFILFLALAACCYAIVTLTNKVNEEKPLPIFIDRISGSARPIDFNVIDAEGYKRHKNEILDFVDNYLNDIYTFNKYTVRSNLESALKKTDENAVPYIKEILRMSQRSKNVNSNNQGMVDIKSIVILNSLPDLKVQVFFEKKILSQGGDEVLRSLNIAVLRIKTVLRQRGNAHGLYVVEYRESKYVREKEVKE